MYTKLYSAITLTLSIALLITGCEQSPKPGSLAKATVQTFAKTTTLNGTVRTGKALIKTGKLEVTDQNGQKLTQVIVENGRFKVDVPADTILPLLLNFTSDNHPEKLQAVVLYDSITTYYIDPSTTAIAKAAKAMGGYIHANLVRAAEETTHTPDSNKTTSGWRGDPTTQYGGWH
jgi:hypothetical protein